MADLALCDAGLKEVPADIAAARGRSVQTLNLSGNELVPPGNLQLFTAVTTLILDHNGLESLEGFPPMPSVTTLWFNNNSVSELVDFMDSVVALFPRLVYLAFMRNPASPPLVCLSEEDTAASHRYRLYVLFRLPRLQFLDASAPTAAERAEAAEKGQYMVVRKPKRAASSASLRLSSGGGGAALGDSADSPSIFSGMGSGFDAGSPGTSRAGAGGDGDGPISPSSAGGSAGPRKPQSHIMVAAASSAYDGRHSEGNRFIRDSQL